MKRIVQRTCMGCNLKKDKKDLLRLVLNKNGEFFVDECGKAEGRGIYVCKNEECLEKAKKTKRLEKTLGIKIDDELDKVLRGVILKNETKNKTKKNSDKLGGDING